MPRSAFCWGWARSEAPHMASHASHSAPTRREDALWAPLLGVGAFRGSTHRLTSLRFCVHIARRCPAVRSVGGGAFRGSTHRVTRVTFCVHTARGCPGVRSVGGRRVQRLHTWRHTRHIPRPHGAKMPWSAFCWGWGVHRPQHIASHAPHFASTRREDALECVLLGVARSGAPHMASHASHSASTRREYALECVLLGVGRSRASTHRVTSLRFRVHIARRCPGVRSVGGGAFTRLHTLRHIAQISRLIGPICALYYRGIASAPVTAPFAR